MSNDKQSMKLYTEKQLTKYLLDEGIMELSDLANNLIPHIQLPSDEEIEEQSWGYREVTKDMEIPSNEDWSNGAIWMRDKIQGGNNEQQ